MMLGAYEVVWKAVRKAPARADAIAISRLMVIAARLSATAREQQLKDAICESDRISINSTANANDMRQTSRLLTNILAIRLFLSAPNTFEMFMSFMLSGIEAIEKFT